MSKLSFTPQPPPAIRAKEEDQEEGDEPSNKAPRTNPTTKKASFKPPPPIDGDSEEEKFGEEVDYDPGEDMRLRLEEEQKYWDKMDSMLEELEEGKGYSTSVGQKHRLIGITDCDIIEVSTPEIGTTWRVEDDYSRPDETEEQRAIERGE